MIPETAVSSTYFHDNYAKQPGLNFRTTFWNYNKQNQSQSHQLRLVGVIASSTVVLNLSTKA